MPSRLNNLKINDVFGNEELLILVFQAPDVLQESTLTRIQNISEAFSESPDFKRVFSLFQVKDIRSEEGSMVVNPVVEFIPQTAEERDELRESIRTNDLAYKIVVSEDFQSAVIILTSEKTVQDEQQLLLVHQILDEYPGEEKVCITGNSYLRVETSEKIGQDLMVLLPLGLLLMFAILYVSFRELRSVLLPFSVVLFSIVISLALIPLFGWGVEPHRGSFTHYDDCHCQQLRSILYCALSRLTSIVSGTYLKRIGCRNKQLSGYTGAVMRIDYHGRNFWIGSAFVFAGQAIGCGNYFGYCLLRCW